ncbi:hypothetical protein HHK36_002115 [Tetracentron sinense]|uniref:Uncharacterized protein n=1 Tax=Tetracentron sinense TaxID=13715 RepID=A0A834ZV73_TETSI|nr:hypothetical protein HHK36_002115 [Tetracentron sinense]
MGSKIRLAVIDHITSMPSILIPVRELVKICCEEGVAQMCSSMIMVGLPANLGISSESDALKLQTLLRESFGYAFAGEFRDAMSELVCDGFTCKMLLSLTEKIGDVYNVEISCEFMIFACLHAFELQRFDSNLTTYVGNRSFTTSTAPKMKPLAPMAVFAHAHYTKPSVGGGDSVSIVDWSPHSKAVADVFPDYVSEQDEEGDRAGGGGCHILYRRIKVADVFPDYVSEQDEEGDPAGGGGCHILYRIKGILSEVDYTHIAYCTFD